LSSRLTERHAALLQRFLGPAQDRPSDCAQARQELLGLVWPGEVPPALAAEPSGTTPETALQSERLRPIGKDTYCDTLLGREVVVLKADADTLPRAAAFARADHPGLACVLCFRPDASCVWIEAARGPQLDRPVTSDEAAELAQALSALHRAGGVHGSVDRNHVRWHGERWVLLFPLEPQAGSAQEDLERLRRLTDD
jgi:serine/threonine-protein kinase